MVLVVSMMRKFVTLHAVHSFFTISVLMHHIVDRLSQAVSNVTRAHGKRLGLLPGAGNTLTTDRWRTGSFTPTQVYLDIYDTIKITDIKLQTIKHH